MLLSEISSSNFFYLVNEPIEVWAFSGHKPSNHYYGSSRIHQAEYKKITLDENDEIHWLVGGLFAVKTSPTPKAYEIRLTPPGDFSPFERSHGGDERAGIIKKYLSSGALERLTASEKTNVGYRS